MTDRLREIAAALNEAGFRCEVTEQVWPAIWEKLAFNAALNTLTAIDYLNGAVVREASALGMEVPATLCHAATTPPLYDVLK